MVELLAILFPILLVDVLNPVLFALLVVAAGSSRPVVNSSTMLLGHTAAYFLAGFAVSFGLEQMSERLANPERIDFAIGGVIGVLLIWAFFRMRGGAAPAADEPEWELTPLKCLGFGAMVNFIGIPFALPYFGAVDQIMKANLGTADSLTVLAIYNIGYALVFAVVPVSVAIVGDRAKPLLERINQFLVRASDVAMPWMILLLGIWLLIDAAHFFVVGKPFGS